MDFVLKMTRYGLIAIMALFAIFAATASARSAHVDATAALVFASSAAAFAIAALWSIARGVAAMMQAASTMLALDAIAFSTLNGSASPAAVNAPLYLALAREGVFIWAILLGGSLLLAWLPGVIHRPAI